MTDIHWMRHALKMAGHSREIDEVPVGAVLVVNNEIVAEGWNNPISTSDPSAHAEMMCLRAGAQKLGNYRLCEATLYVTLEPCLMCAGAMIHARIARLVFGAYDPKTGVASSVMAIFNEQHLNHRIRFEGGILKEDCSKLLSDFFKARRNNT